MDDREWIAAAVARYQRPLAAYVAGLLGDPHRGHDVVQDAFLELCRRPRADVQDRLAAWLFAVCRRRAIDILRKETRMTALPADPPAHADGPAATAERADAAAAVLARVSRLPANQQEALRLRFQNEFSYRDIAAVMGLSESHVGVLLHTAIKNLRRSFADPADQPTPAQGSPS